MIKLSEIIHQLTSNAEAIRAMVGRFSDEDARWKPDAETWSMQDVMQHMLNEERLDFRKHLKEIFHDPPQPWSRQNEAERTVVTSCREALDSFLAERQDSIAWLKVLPSPDWDLRIEAPWGGTISAGDVLVSWVEHDFLHMRQMNEILYAWNKHKAEPYSVEYAGDW